MEPTLGLRFEWDEAKNKQNIRKHGFDFAHAPEIFAGLLYAVPDTRFDYHEERWLGAGLFRGRVVVVAFTQPELQVIRLISIRKATAQERRDFEEKINNQS